jgi:hypothetical protein
VIPAPSTVAAVSTAQTAMVNLMIVLFIIVSPNDYLPGFHENQSYLTRFIGFGY